MNMLKNLLLTILGWFRVKGNNAVDLRYAGIEKSAQIKAKIKEVNDQRNQIAANGLVIKNKIKELQEKVQQSLDAVKHHSANGNDALKIKAYNDYTTFQSNLDSLLKSEQDYDNQVAYLDEQLRTLEQDAEDAKNTLNQAASRQVVGKAMTSVEDIHDDLKSGSLSEAIEQSDNNSAVAQVRRDQRISKDTSEVYDYQKKSNVKSLDEILNS